MQAHSASERSVGYLFLMRARVANHYPTHPFRTVSEGVFSEVRLSADAVVSVLLASAGACLLVHPPGCILDSACDPNNRKGNSPPTMIVVYGVLVVCGACLAAVVGLTLVQRLVPATIRKEYNDVAGFIYAVLGVIYAVLLALVVIAVWEEFDAAKDTAEQEANALAEIFWLAHQLPELEGRHVQELARSYAEEVVEEEWPLMEQGQASPRGWVLIDDIRANLQGYEPHTVADQELYSEELDQVQRLADARRMRLVAAQESIPTVLWVVLVFGGVAVVGFTYLFGMDNTWAHRLMVVYLAGVIALVVFTIGAMEHPFSGGARVGPEAFELILDRFETSKLSDLR